MIHIYVLLLVNSALKHKHTYIHKYTYLYYLHIHMYMKEVLISLK